ncbi:MAG: cation-translocating P-type ATPase [Anaerolineae bacterium]
MQEQRDTMVRWHAQPADEVASRLGVRPETGLNAEEAATRLTRSGPNRLRPAKTEPFIEEFFEELREPMILLLLGTGVLYGLWGGLEDALTILLVTAILVTVEVLNEQRAARAIASLHRLTEPRALVRRSGSPQEVDSEQVVPGDVLLLVAGKRVVADARLVEARGLAMDESTLTGESVPADKQLTPMGPDTPLAERADMVYAGTSVARGRGTAIVVATAASTELGRIAGLARDVKPPKTPLQQDMNDLSRTLVWLALALSALVPALGLLAGQPLSLMVLTGLSLAFATIPEELPIIITMVLALGGYRLSRQKAIARDLRAVETLGTVTVIATDKTGTLTENRMAVAELTPPSAAPELLRLGLLAGAAPIVAGDADGVGDPMDLAMLRAASESGQMVDRTALAAAVDREYAFDNSRRMASVVYRENDGNRLAARGAPEAILGRSHSVWVEGRSLPLTDAGREALLAQVAALAAAGERVIAVAERQLPDGGGDQDEAEHDLTFVGLVAFADPPRPEAEAAIAATRQAGIRTIMITGDHPLTAHAIAAQVGLDGAGGVVTGAEIDTLSDADLAATLRRVSVFARATAEHKLRIVQALIASGERVAVTGDGTNDAPALAAADIGVAMGETGTDVARETGDIILADDNFATIVRAIEQGRMLFANLTKGVRYYLSCKVALIAATLLPVLLGVPVPFAPVQIILMELFMDLAASAAFVAEPAEAGLMLRPPRDPRKRFMDRAMVASIVTAAAGLFAAVTVAYLATWYSGAGLATAQTMAFVTWLAGHVLLAANMRSEREPLLRLGLLSNRVMLVWAAATAVFVLVVTGVPAMRAAVGTTALAGGQWLLALVVAVVGTFWMEVRRLARG